MVQLPSSKNRSRKKQASKLNLQLLKGMVNPIAIAQTLTLLTNEGSSIDDAFLRLQSNIIKNNESAKIIVQDIASSVENVSELNKTRIDIGNKITNYISQCP
jgi:hypothetical protein